jgi:hypothetical protein
MGMVILYIAFLLSLFFEVFPKGGYVTHFFEDGFWVLGIGRRPQVAFNFCGVLL